MRILAKKTADSRLHRALIFGMGQIGTAIAMSLNKLGFHESESFAFDRHDVTQRRLQAERISDHLAAVRGETRRMSIIWSAGNCGFHSTERQTEAVAETAAKLEISQSAVKVRVHRAIRKLQRSLEREAT